MDLKKNMTILQSDRQRKYLRIYHLNIIIISIMTASVIIRTYTHTNTIIIIILIGIITQCKTALIVQKVLRAIGHSYRKVQIDSHTKECHTR